MTRQKTVTKRVQVCFSIHALRYTEFRWCGNKTQWVISGVQIAAWSRMDTRQPRCWFTVAPLRRWPDEARLTA